MATQPLFGTRADPNRELQQVTETALRIRNPAAFSGALAGGTAGNLFARALKDSFGSDPQLEREKRLAAIEQAFASGQIELEDVPAALRASGLGNEAVAAQQMVTQMRQAEASAQREQIGVSRDQVALGTEQSEAKIRASQADPAVLKAQQAEELAQARKAAADAALAKGELAHQPKRFAIEADNRAREISKQRFDSALSAQNAIRQDPIYKDVAISARGWDTLTTAYDELASGTDSPGTADLALVIGLYQILDPNSIVREGEASLAGARASAVSQVRAFAAQLESGGNLSNEERQQIYRIARTTMAKKQAKVGNLRSAYGKAIPRSVADREAAMAPLNVISTKIPTGPPPKLPKSKPRNLQSDAERASKSITKSVLGAASGAASGVFDTAVDATSRAIERDVNRFKRLFGNE